MKFFTKKITSHFFEAKAIAFVPTAFFFCMLLNGLPLAAQTVITTQTGNMDATRVVNNVPASNTFADTYNFGAELANYANQNSGSNVTPGAAAFRTFTTNQGAIGGTARPLRPGDRFIITAFSNTPATSGIIGISFKNNTTYTGVADYNNGEVCRFEMTAGGNWTIVHSGGTITTAATSGADRTFQLDITSSNTFDATIAGVTYNNLGFINAGPVASFCIYNMVTVAAVNRSNPNSFWKGASLQGRPIVFGGTANATITGNITNGGNENSTVLSATNTTFSNTGIITLNPGTGNTYTGATSITAGTVRLGAANAIPNTNITISNNATLSTGAAAGFNETAGVLTMTTSATIALGTGAHILNFAASNAAAWTGTLTITGWDVTNAGQIFFGNTSGGLTAGQLAQINFAGFGTGAKILATGEILPANLYISTQTGLYNTGTTWVGGIVPPSGASVYISNTHNVTLDVNANVSSLLVATGGTFTATDGAARTLTISSGASATTLVVNGSWANGAGASSVSFTTSAAVGTIIHTITGTAAFNNVSIQRTAGTPNIGVTFSAGSTINNNFTLFAGGFVQTTPPVYGSSSTLIYNSGNTYVISAEWTAGATAGAGYPNDVQLGSALPNSGLSISNGNTYHLRGNFTFSVAGSALTMTTSTLNIGKSWINNGTTANFTCGTGTVGFAGTVAETVGGTNINAGGYAFNNLTVNKTSGSVTLSNTLTTIANTLTVNGSGTFSLNGNSLSIVNLVGNSATAILNNNSATNLTLTITDGGGNTFAGVIQNGSTGTFSIVKAGAGTQALSGANSYSGTTLVSAGTLIIGSTLSGNGLSVNSNYTFSGGNLTIANLPAASVVNGGTINIQANTSITLTGPNAYTVNFAASNGVSWDLTRTVTIFNWTPSAGRSINVGTTTGLTGPSPGGQLGRINFDNYGVGSKLVGIEVRPAFLYVTQASGSGNYTAPASWLFGDQPVLNDGTESIFIQGTFALTFDAGTPILNVLRAEIAPGANLTMAAGERINIFPTGDFRVNGTINMLGNSYIDLRAGTNFQLGGTVNMSSTAIVAFAAGISMIATSPSANFSSAGTLDFAGNFIITSITPNAILLPNVNLRASVDFGQNSTLQNGSSLNMLTGGFVNNNAPIYASGSTLAFRTGGTYGRNLEWSAISGKGYPSNVLITNNTVLDLGAWGGASTTRQCGGSVTIDAGSALTMNQGGTSMNAPLVVLGNVNVNGELRLGGGAGGNINIGGDYTFGATGTVLNNGREVIFDGSAGNQLITRTGGGLVYIDFLTVNKSVGDLQLNGTVGNVTNAYLISNINDISKYVIKLLNGRIDMNDGIITLEGNQPNSINIGVGSGSTRTIFTSTGTGEFRIIGAVATTTPRLNVVPITVNSKLLFDNNVLVNTTVGVNFGVSGTTTFNAIFRIDQNGYVVTNSPDYGPSSTLIYNNGSGGYLRNMEWNTNTPGATGAGYPNNIVVQNNTPVELNSTTWPATFPLGCSGKLTIEQGSSLITSNMAYTLSVGDSFNLRGTLTLSTDPAGDFFVGGNWNRGSTGVFTQNDRMVTFDSTNTTTIRAAGGQTFSRLTINKKTSVSSIAVDSAVTVTNELFLQRGALTLNNDVTLTSDNTRTARIGETTTPANIPVTYGAGKFVIQRYLPIANTASARRWRLMTAPLTTGNAPTINAAWQEGQSSPNRLSPINNIPGFGTAITWGTIAANGYDQGITNNPSIMRYNTGADAWEGIPSTTSGKITDQPGYMLFVRGDRSIVITGTTDLGTPTTLRTRGEINIGGVTTALNPSGFQVLGNPYASAISFNNVTFNGVNPGTTAGRSFYMWDPKLVGSRNVGGWVTFTSLGNGTYTVGPNSSGYLNTGVIESGAAIMVDAAGGNFIFNENCKIAASSTVGLASRPANGNNAHQFFTASLNVLVNGVPKLSDGVVTVGHDNFNNEVNGDDAPKLISFSSAEKICIARDGKDLSVELRKNIKTNDTIFYELSKLAVGSYQLSLEAKDIDNGLVAILEDKFTGEQKLLDVNAATVYPFNVTADSCSAGSRFRVVFRAAVQFTALTAIAVNGNVIANWATANEHKIASYEVERSSDGNSFTAVGNVPAGSNGIAAGNYQFTDISPRPGKYVYRIKAITASGGFVFSNTAQVTLLRQSNAVYVFPNPVNSGLIRLHMDKQSPGIYQLRLFSSNGQQVYSGSLNHAAGTAVKELKLPGLTAGGVYQLEITSKGSPKIILPVVIQQ